MSKPFVAILMGSVSDLPTLQPTVDFLRQFDIPFEAKVTSAHRTPERTHEYVRDAERRGCAVFIAAAGLAAQILAVSDPRLAKRLPSERRDNAEAIAAADARVMEQLGQG